MKSILILCESLSIGGAEKALYNLLKYIDKKQYNITVCTICDIGYFSTLIKQIPNITYKSLLIPYNSGLKGFIYKLKYNFIYKYIPNKYIYKFFIPKNHDIEIAFCEGFSTKVLSNSNNTKSHKIAWIHTDLLNNNWPLKSGIYSNEEEEKQSYLKFDTIIGVSNSVTKNLKEFLYNNNIYTVYNIIYEDDIRKQAQNTSNIIISNSAFNIVSVGRLAKVKGYDRLIRVCIKLIKEDDLNVYLTIVGGGSEHKSLQDLINRSSVSDNIKLLGPKNNPYSYMSQADLYVCPSYQEGFNIALAEAIVLELPCVATNCSGPDEILDNGKYGVLTANNEESLYQNIKLLINNQSELIGLKKKAIERKSFFCINKNLSTLYNILKR